MDIYSRVYKIAIVEGIEKEQIKQLSKMIKSSRIYCYLDNSVDIISFDISKWGVFKKLNISNKYKKVIAFGNDKNDVELLHNSDIGVAVATEDKELLSFSAVRVSSCKPNAIVSAIDKIDSEKI